MISKANTMSRIVTPLESPSPASCGCVGGSGVETWRPSRTQIEGRLLQRRVAWLPIRIWQGHCRLSKEYRGHLEMNCRVASQAGVVPISDRDQEDRKVKTLDGCSLVENQAKIGMSPLSGWKRKRLCRTRGNFLLQRGVLCHKNYIA